VIALTYNDASEEKGTIAVDVAITMAQRIVVAEVVMLGLQNLF
jgi:hypothetical protein